MESKLLVGGKNIVDHTNEQQKILEQKRQEIAEQVSFCFFWGRLGWSKARRGYRANPSWTRLCEGHGDEVWQPLAVGDPEPQHPALRSCTGVVSGQADEFCDVVQKRREREIQQQMESRDEETLELKETYSSLQQEVDIKTKKLKKVSKERGQAEWSWDVGERKNSVSGGCLPHLLLPWVPALFQASGGESRDPRPPRRAHQGASGAGADSEWAHQGAETQVSSGPSMAPPATAGVVVCWIQITPLRTGPLTTSLQFISWHRVFCLFLRKSLSVSASHRLTEWLFHDCQVSFHPTLMKLWKALASSLSIDKRASFIN